MTGLSRRAFLAASAAAAAQPAWAAPASGEVDVVIVGAGGAGIAAARRIVASRRRVTLVEAAGRIGGRCVTDVSSFGVAFDRGARTIYSPDVNPVAKLAARTGLDVYPAPSGQKMRVGRRSARDSELEDFLAALVRSNRAIAEAARGKADVSCAQALPKDLGDWRPSVGFALGPYACARDLNEVSAMDYARWAERDTAAFCRQGFGALLAKLADGLPVQLGAAVTQIGARSNRVEVRTAKGTVSARYAIITASTNVLAGGAIKFDPELPKRQLDALSKLELGSFDHIALELAGNPLGVQRDDLVFEKAAGASTAALIANVSGTPLAVVEVAGKFGRELSAKGDLAMVDFATEWLAGLYGADIRRAVRRTQATRWNAEPWTRGALATAAPGAQGARKILMEPLRDRIFFAGEAAHETLCGTVGGAWESGERAADAVLRKLGVLKDEEEPRARRRPARQRE